MHSDRRYEMERLNGQTEIKTRFWPPYPFY